MMVSSWTWGLIPLVAPLVGDVALYIPDDNDPLDPLLSTVRYSWLIGGLMAKKVLVFIAELLVGKAWEGWCDAQMIPGGGAAGTQMLR